MEFDPDDSWAFDPIMRKIGVALLLFVLIVLGTWFGSSFQNRPLLDEPSTAAQKLNDVALINDLIEGGYVIVMRHASAPFDIPDAESADPGNIYRERQLDEAGKETASAMGVALKQLSIPIGEVLSSTLYRTMQTAELLDLADVEYFPELAEVASDPALAGDFSSQLQAERSAWLSAKAAEPTAVGTNRLIITHRPNLVGAFGGEGSYREGESLIIKPESGRAVVIDRVKIEDWPTFVAN